MAEKQFVGNRQKAKGRRNSVHNFYRIVSKVRAAQRFKLKRSVSESTFEHREENSHNIPVLVTETDKEKLEKEKNELKSKIEELESYKTQFEQEKQQNERLQSKLDQMVLGQSDASLKLAKSNELAERLRTDNKKKTELIEKYQRDVRFMEDRLRNLEIRASEVEKAELILDTTRQNLESTNAELRDREHQIRRMESERNELEKKLDMANQKISDMELKITDLNLQVRCELMRNEGIEKNLETIPRLKETIEENTKQIEALTTDLQDKTTLLVAARKSAREYKEQLRGMEHKVAKAEQIQTDYEMTQCEVETLKRLLQGKDHLVIQKSKALDVAKDVIETMNISTEPEQIDKIVLLLERMGASTNRNLLNGTFSESSNCDSDIHSRSFSSQHHRTKHRDIDVNRNPYSSDRNYQKNMRRPLSGGGFLDNLCNEDKSKPKTAIVHPVKRSQSLRDASSNKGIIHNGKTDSRSEHTSNKKPSKFQPSVDYIIGLHSNSATRTGSASPRSPSWNSKSEHSVSLQSVDSSDSSDSENSDVKHVQILAKLSAKEREKILQEYINVGDRITIAVPQKPPRYGKKIVPKPKLYTGIVKYRGTLEKVRYDPRIYVGVRIDEPEGDTDGTYKGKRYMYTPSDLGKFFKLIDLTSVLDCQKGKYQLVTSILSSHLSTQGKVQSSSG